ncbi:MAG: hypothetical protein FWD97_05300 [Defluviitaleaceae bacterium]|nr:hypothetical protein [Defluviitaleaceae bacterium]
MFINISPNLWGFVFAVSATGMGRAMPVPTNWGVSIYITDFGMRCGRTLHHGFWDALWMYIRVMDI